MQPANPRRHTYPWIFRWPPGKTADSENLTASDDDARFREQKLKIDPANNGAKSEYREALSLSMLLHKHSYIQTIYHPSDNPVQ